ncbi:erythromycin esterase family protein [Phytomonospora sp. NPDC050363]|uniref:erythromycin esterase family protein n=1 Tax=Phytomonospora sp. NPDC050363 TaxID=3155642 RepID=UPI0034023CA9
MSTHPARLSGAAVRPLTTLDPSAPLDDLAWLDDLIGDARVVAVGESSHYNREQYLLRHRLLRYLVTRHGFSAYATESGFTEGRLVDRWVRGDGPDGPARVQAEGMTSLMGLWTEMGAHLEWMREHNASAEHPVGFHGVDLSGSNISLLPALDAVLAHLAAAEPGRALDPRLREAAAACSASSAFSAMAALGSYTALPVEARDALTAGLADLGARLAAGRFEYIAATSREEHERAVRSLALAAALDAMIREMTSGGGSHGSIRDAAIADNVEWVLRREDRVVLTAHNGHVQRTPVAVPGAPESTTAGMHLTERLGGDYVVIGTTTGTGQSLHTGPGFYTGTLFEDLEPPRAGSLDALMDATHDGPFAVRLGDLPATDTATVRAASEQRISSFYAPARPLDAFDAIVHLPRVTAAEPDPAALAHAPEEVREPFAKWTASAGRRHAGTAGG